MFDSIHYCVVVFAIDFVRDALYAMELGWPTMAMSILRGFQKEQVCLTAYTIALLVLQWILLGTHCTQWS